MVDETADSLREMAQHRGLKLVKSRRRKPGTGDYGKFGLTDDQGKPLLGIGDEGLTASAEDIENYLRAGAASTWQQSAKILPDRPAPRGKVKRGEPDAQDSATFRRGRGEAAGGVSVEGSKAAVSQSSPQPESEPQPKSEGKPARPARRREATSWSGSEPGNSNSNSPDRPAAAKSKPVEVEPDLVLRAAKPTDAGPLAKLLGQLSGPSASKDEVARHLAALRKSGSGIHVAESGTLVGCIGWAVVSTLQRGPVGRITVLVIDEAHRRQGIGTLLLAEAEAALAKKGCAIVEAMSDIQIKNSHNFFRTLKFDQISYRFARAIAR
ncbi:GNAT family N-acetyltransferase [Novosphingobium sp. G106]|uniref:GNAT family N-acetyltransferase n=1 Tax=Novosphingobium sp. G106 TaxID=2849500 RepID=UPI001C2DCAD4|nr:GNAT family N-acetyltransferase [Novosphingobium sp. G106]MBV1690340.1 GNAT family N-acetyltransferase [Novosphingobium sp. G106]